MRSQGPSAIIIYTKIGASSHSLSAISIGAVLIHSVHYHVVFVQCAKLFVNSGNSKKLCVLRKHVYMMRTTHAGANRKRIVSVSRASDSGSLAKSGE